MSVPRCGALDHQDIYGQLHDDVIAPNMAIEVWECTDARGKSMLGAAQHGHQVLRASCWYDWESYCQSLRCSLTSVAIVTSRLYVPVCGRC